ncbi:MAG: peptide chain release factor N(5)-glutamine methyltransferase [Gammaproteobacteria bacterium]|nr:peptide chain release factor N(5)-glutamine methyltransferase [Gammaproteobacteria bacterium]MCF6230180.1 peptide chain release factor N(5)-glutamine methyltransferase [Gammaproteobacteria bacterium]
MDTLQQALQQATQQLSTSNSTSPRVDAEALLCHLLKKSPSHLIAWPEKRLSSAQQQAFKALLQRRVNGEPIAYIAGHREFWSLDLRVTPATLIPRPDTELLVEQALERIPNNAQWQIADLGTGSGAIALAIASERPRCQLYAVDISADALAVARQNATQLAIPNVTFLQGDWLASLQQKSLNMVVSNPPYIENNDQHLEQGDLRFEPKIALSSGTDGLDDIRLLIKSSRQPLQPDGWLLLEHGYQQSAEILEIMRQQGYRRVQGHIDYGGNDRVACGQI